MRHGLVFGFLCSGLGACAIPPSASTLPYVPISPMRAALSGDLPTDRQACNAAYPAEIGNYLRHAECVNTAVEHDALSKARYPDLVRLQEQLRVNYSAQIDNRTITAKTGENKMAEADELVAEATIERDAGRAEIADNHIARLQTILQR